MASVKESTLLELVQSVMNETESDDEVVATIVYLINSGRVRLCGTFKNAKISFPGDVILPSGRSFPSQYAF